MQNQYPNSGTLFNRPKRTPKSADYGGDFTIDGEVLDFVLRAAQAGKPVKLEMSGWRRQGRNDTNFISLKVDIPYEVRKNAPAPAAGRQYSRPFPDQQNATPANRGSYDRTGQSGFRKELNDDIPDFGRPRRADTPPWE